MTTKKLVLILLAVALLIGLIFLAKKGTPRTSSDIHIEESALTYKVDVDVSRTENAGLNASVEAYVTAQAREFAEMYGPTMFTEEELELLGFNAGRQYELVIKGEPWRHTTLSGMTVELYTFTGGAHGNTTYVPFIVDEAGLPVTLEKLFAPNTAYLERLSSAVKEPLKAQLEDSEMYVEDFFTEGTSPSDGNFFVDAIGDEGITFIFQQYQVAPYVAGSPRVTVPFEALADILNPAYFE